MQPSQSKSIDHLEKRIKIDWITGIFAKTLSIINYQIFQKMRIIRLPPESKRVRRMVNWILLKLPLVRQMILNKLLGLGLVKILSNMMIHMIEILEVVEL